MPGFDRLTKKAIKALEPGQSIIEHGITALRTRSKDVRYSVNVMVDGRRIHRVIGLESEGITRTQAEIAIAAFRTKAREERLELPTGRKLHRTFSEGAAEYLKRMDNGCGKNMKAKRQHLTVRLIPYFGEYRLDRIETLAVQEFIQSRIKDGAQQATINRELATLSHCFRRLAEWKWLDLGRIPKIEKGNEPRKRVVILTNPEKEALLQSAQRDVDEQTYLFVAFGLCTAMRHSEILRVRFDQIDFTSGRIFIPEAKAGQREQPVAAWLLNLLKAERSRRKDKEGWIFFSTRSDSKTPYRTSMADQFARAVLAAGLSPKRVTPHVMRHTAITDLVQAGVDLPSIQSVSGHKTLSMVMRYVHLSGNHIDAAVAHLNPSSWSGITQELHTA